METIKKEKKADLEQMLAKLLNDLLRMWWKPFNRDKTLHINCYDKCKWLNYKWIHLDGWFMNEESRTLRELVSIDSWLWQFVCENGMIPYDEDWYTWYERTKDYYDDFENSNSKMLDLAIDNRYEYRLIESSLKDESELEDFLLQNIKVWNED